MLWFWFHLIGGLTMLALNVVCLVAVWRLTKRWLWRAVAGIFLGAQTLAHLTLMCGFNWTSFVPRSIYVAGFMWHYFGLATVGTLLFLFVCFHLSRRTVRKIKAQPLPDPPAISETRSVSRREFFGAAAALAPPLFTIGATSIAMAQLNSFRVRRFTLAIPALPRDLEGLTIAHVSDVHVGRLTNGRVLKKIIETTNSLRADLIAVTGDLIDFEISDLSGAIDLLKSLQSNYGLWMVEGNHDLFDNGNEFERRVKASGIPLLLNESAITHVRGHPLQLFGLNWLDTEGWQRDQATILQLRELMKHRHPDTFPILLAHHPHTFDAAVAANLPLTLVGHTHGGQLMLNQSHGVGSVLFRYWTGLYRRANSQMIVSNGVGNMFPIRINAPAEIVHLTLRAA